MRPVAVAVAFPLFQLGADADVIDLVNKLPELFRAVSFGCAPPCDANAANVVSKINGVGLPVAAVHAHRTRRAQTWRTLSPFLRGVSPGGKTPL